MLQLPFIPPYIQAIDFRLRYTHYFFNLITYHTDVNENSTHFNYTITFLTINTTYTLSISADGEYPWCSYNNLRGNTSELVYITTTETSEDYLLCIAHLL